MSNRTLPTMLASLALIAATALQAAPAAGQFYTFTSGPGGDGFNWPASPTGVLDGNFYETPDGVSFDNFTGNQIFFDDNYLVASNSPDITGDALWGNPNSGSLDIYLGGFGGVQSVEFSFANSVGGAPGNSQDVIDIFIIDSEGREAVYTPFLGNTYTGIGGFDGYSDVVQFDTSFLIDEFENVDGGPLIDIESFYIDMFSLDNTLDPTEFAIDNFSIDGSGGGGPDEVFPSVNGGQFDVTGSTLGSNSLRGVGTHFRSLEVTNGGSGSTTYSIQIEPGGDMTAGPNVVSGELILDGETQTNGNLASLDRSLPSGTYLQDVRVINDGDPSDPDNITTFKTDLYEPQVLSGNMAGVDLSAGDKITLANAAAPANGFRAAVKVLGSQTTGPFTVTGFDVDDRVLDGDVLQSTSVQFNRFGQLSGLRTGTFTVSLEQTAYVVNQQVDFETFLANAESVPDEVWNLNYTHVNATSDIGAFTGGFTLVGRIGVNTFDVAATFIDGVSAKNQNIGFQIMPDPDPTSADLIGDAVDLTFGGGDSGELFVLQLTYLEGGVPGGAAEGDLRLLWFDTVADDWAEATDGNTGGTPTFFSGSYEDYLSGGTLGAGDLGAYGLDTTNDHVWAVLNHASLFAVGVLSTGSINGDYNGSGQVEQGDLDLVLQNWGLDTGTAGIPSGWINDLPSGQIEQTELDGVLQNWGNTSAPPNFSGGDVPEPAAGLLVLALTGLARRRAA